MDRPCITYRGEGYPGIGDWPIVPFAGWAPRDAIAWEAAGQDRVGTTTVARYRLHHSGGLVVPLVHVRCEGAPRGDLVLRLGLKGRVQAGDWKAVESLLADGHEVVSLDPRALGETRMRYKAASIDDPELAPKDEEAPTRARSRASWRTTSTTRSSSGGRTSSR